MPTVRLTYDERPSNVFLNVHILLLIIKRSSVHLQLLLLYYEPLVVLMLLASFSRTKPVFGKYCLPRSLLNPIVNLCEQTAQVLVRFGSTARNNNTRNNSNNNKQHLYSVVASKDAKALVSVWM